MNNIFVFLMVYGTFFYQKLLSEGLKYANIKIAKVLFY